MQKESSKKYTSISYDLNLDSTLRSNNETHKNNSPPEIISHILRNNILTLDKKCDQLPKNFKSNMKDNVNRSRSKKEKSISLDSDGKQIISIKKVSEMDIILEEKEDKNIIKEKIESIHINFNKENMVCINKVNNNLSSQVIENVVIDFKKKFKETINDAKRIPSILTKSPESTRKLIDNRTKLDSQNRSKQKSPLRLVEKSPRNHFKNQVSINFDQNTVFSFINESRFITRSPEVKSKNINSSIEKVVKPQIYSTIFNQGDRNNALRRSNSPGVNFNNTTTNSIKASLVTTLMNKSNKKTTINDKNNMKKSPINDKITSATHQDKKDIKEISTKRNINFKNMVTKMNFMSNKKGVFVNLGSPTCGNKSHRSPKTILEEKILQKDLINFNKNSNQEHFNKDIVKKNLVDKILDDKGLILSKDKALTYSSNKNDTKKDSNYSKLCKTARSKPIYNDEFQDIIAKKEILEFACCTINSISEVQEKIKTHCSINKISIKDIRTNKFECSSHNFVIGIEFTKDKSIKFMKIYHVRGKEVPDAKDLLKALMNLAL